MSTQPAMYFTTIGAAEADTLPDLARVRVLRDVEADEGASVPRGSIGTVVAIWSAGAAYDVEFTRPVAALVTVEAADLALEQAPKSAT